MNVPFLSLRETHNPIKTQLLKAFEQVLESQWFILGERVKQFELEYARFNNVTHCLGISNGLDALILALKALQIGVGHEVIVPSNTYIATALAVTAVGATPIFVEPREDTMNIDVSKIEAAITSKTRAIMPVHLYGQCCEMKDLMVLAKEKNLFVIEDNAQAQGSTFQGTLAGSFGNVNATSFYPGKNLGALGDAGAITTNDSNLAEKIRVLRNYGSQKKYYNEVIGHNMRLDEMQAAFLSVKLPHLNQWTLQRQQLAAHYDRALSGTDGINTPVTAAGATHVYHLYVIQTPRRNELQTFLETKSIGSLIHYPVPPHLQQAYANMNLGPGAFPIAERLANSCLSLPLWPGMTEQQVEHVVASIKIFFSR